MIRRKLYFLGLFAPFLFAFTVILGGALRPGYDHVADTVSELFSPGSPNRFLLSVFYTLFAVLLSLFGIGLLQFVNHIGKLKTLGIPAAIVFISVGALQILSATIFPQDPWGATPTIFGRLHIIVHGFISILSLIYIVLFGLWFHRTGIAKSFMIYSLATVTGVIIAAVWLMVSYGTDLMGISERMAAVIGFQWTIALAIVVLKYDHP